MPDFLCFQGKGVMTVAQRRLQPATLCAHNLGQHTPCAVLVNPPAGVQGRGGCVLWLTLPVPEGAAAHFHQGAAAAGSREAAAAGAARAAAGGAPTRGSSSSAAVHRLQGDSTAAPQLCGRGGSSSSRRCRHADTVGGVMLCGHAHSRNDLTLVLLFSWGDF